MNEFLRLTLRKKWILSLFIILSLALQGQEPAQSTLSGSYYDLQKPGDHPEIFAPQFISSSADELNAAFSPDGRTFYFSMRRGYYFNIFKTEMLDDGTWTPIRLAPFSGKYSDADPVFNQDGSRLYYCTTRQSDPSDTSRDFNIAYVELSQGSCSDPHILSFCTEEDECFVSFTRDEKEFYFHRRINGNNYLFRVEKTSNGFTPETQLPAPLNSGESDWDPMIAPDGSFILFSSSRIGNLGRGDLYVSFQEGDSWTEPQNLGPEINTPGMDYCPSLSPDGQYLFYSSYRYLPIQEPGQRNSQSIIDLFRGPGNGYGDIYWVSADRIHQLNPEHHTLASKNEFSFQLDRNKVIVPVSVNGNRSLNIILDTGMPWSGLYLFHSEFIDEFELDSNIEVSVGGAGSGNASSGLQTHGHQLTIDGAKFNDQMVVVSRSSHTQTFPTDGVIGWTIFSSPVVLVDYDVQKISLMDQLPELDDDWKAIDIELNENHLPFITIQTAVQPGDSLQPMIYYLDLASGENFEMLVKKNMKYTLPESEEDKVMGTGLSGDFKGFSGQISRIEIAGFTVWNCPATFVDAQSRTTQGAHSDGVIGAGFMKRFQTIYDYPHHKIYIKPSKHFEQ